MRRQIPFLSCLALIGGLSAWGVGAAHAGGYPRLGLYGGIQGIGYPYILGGNRSGPLDLATCDSVARYDQVILDASPISEYRPDVAARLRATHPGISLLAYVNAGNIWFAAQPDSNVHYPTRFRRLIRKLGGFLYDRAGREYPTLNVNYAKKDGAGRYVVAESLAVLFQDAIVRTGIWDGMFLDVYCDRIAWAQAMLADSIDFVRAGYPTLAAFDAAYQAGTDVLANRLRALAGPSFLLVGNCAQGTKYTLFNGWMRENFPNQNGGNWYENMFRDPGGYFVDEAKFLPPRQNYLFSAANPAHPYDVVNTRKARFGLGSSSLGGGFSAFGEATRDISLTNYSGWWYDEYAVDLTTGRSSDRLVNTGWLGQPLGAAWQMIWPGTGPDASGNPDFEADLTGWTFAPNAIPATFTRDTGTSASGLASAHVHVSSAGIHDWDVNLNTAGTIGVSVGTIYSATFWARAASPRTLPVILGLTVGGEVARRTVALTTTWQRFQVALIPSKAGTGRLSFFLAGAAGDVWLDDVHLQAGASSLWRRDFQNGIVLVNPSFNTLTADLGRTFRRIAGVMDPAVNDGMPSSQITIGPQDARFLLGDDMLPPAPVLDLHPVPR